MAKVEGVEILSEKIENNEKVTVFRTDNGTTVTMHVPFHTPEEEQKIQSNFVRAAAKMLYPDMDLTNTKITLICD